MPALPADFLGPATLDDPHSHFRRLQSEDPVHRSDWLRSWVLTRYSDVASVLALSENLSADTVQPAYFRLSDRQRAERAVTFRTLMSWLPFSDPPDHGRLRRLVSKALTPRVVAAMRPRIQQACNEMIARLGSGADTVDLIDDFSHPLTLRVICGVLGVPVEDHDQVLEWAEQIYPVVHGALGDPSRHEKAETGFRGLDGYFRKLAAERRAHPAEDLVTALVRAEDEQALLTTDEVVATCILVVFAGQETTTSLLANAVLSLLEFPEQLALLRARPEAIEPAIEEFVRFRGTAYSVTRVVRTDFEVSGTLLRAGERVVMVLGAANRDPARFDQADELVLERTPNRHLGFGASIHFCLGAPLARMETRIAIPALLDAFPGLRLADGTQPVWQPLLITRQLESLSVGL